MVASTVVMPREGSFALALFGRMRKVQESPFAVSAGWMSFELKQILEVFLVILVAQPCRATMALIQIGTNKAKLRISIMDYHGESASL